MEDGKWYFVDMTNTLSNSGNVDWQDGLLLGTTSAEFNNQKIYHTSELYMGKEGWFTFPEMAKDQYVYTGTTTDFSYVLVDNTFTDSDCNTSGHKYGIAEVSFRDCTHNQYANYICEKCGKKVSMVMDKAQGHIFIEKKDDWECELCGMTMAKKMTDAAGKATYKVTSAGRQEDGTTLLKVTFLAPTKKYKNAKIIVPKKLKKATLKDYKVMLKNAGLPKKAKIKKG